MKRLQAEIRKADKLGISYGRYKAIQLERARLKVRTPQEEQKGKKSNEK